VLTNITSLFLTLLNNEKRVVDKAPSLLIDNIKSAWENLSSQALFSDFTEIIIAILLSTKDHSIPVLAFLILPISRRTKG
jgi:hypothetical protein